MITCQLAGGLGNMMFQVAAGAAHAWRWRVPFIVNFKNHVGLIHKPPSHYQRSVFRKVQAGNGFPTNLEVFHYPDHPYKEIPKKLPLKLEGYFQTEKYFIDEESYIRDLYEPVKADLDWILNKYPKVTDTLSVSLHVRRGDYLTYVDHHPPVTKYYCEDALDYVGDYDNLFIFSDDIKWCKENLKFKNITFIEEEDYLSLYLMSQCNHNIIANSSFSWWGAWLNSFKNKKVVAPATWFGKALSHINTKDLIPDSWLKL